MSNGVDLSHSLTLSLSLSLSLTHTHTQQGRFAGCLHVLFAHSARMYRNFIGVHEYMEPSPAFLVHESQSSL